MSTKTNGKTMSCGAALVFLAERGIAWDSVENAIQIAMDAKAFQTGGKGMKKQPHEVKCHAQDPGNCRYHHTGKYANIKDKDLFTKSISGGYTEDDIQSFLREQLEGQGFDVKTFAVENNGKSLKATLELNAGDADAAMEQIETFIADIKGSTTNAEGVEGQEEMWKPEGSGFVGYFKTPDMEDVGKTGSAGQTVGEIQNEDTVSSAAAGVPDATEQAEVENQPGGGKADGEKALPNGDLIGDAIAAFGMYNKGSSEDLGDVAAALNNLIGEEKLDAESALNLNIGDMIMNLKNMLDAHEFADEAGKKAAYSAIQKQIAKAAAEGESAQNDDGQGSFTETEHDVMDICADAIEALGATYENPEWDHNDEGELTLSAANWNDEDDICPGVDDLEKALKKAGYEEASVSYNADKDAWEIFIGEKTGAGAPSAAQIAQMKKIVENAITGEGGDLGDATWEQVGDEYHIYPESAGNSSCPQIEDDLSAAGFKTANVKWDDDHYVVQPETGKAKPKAPQGASQKDYAQYLPEDEADMATGDVIAETFQNLSEGEGLELDILGDGGVEETDPFVFAFEVTGTGSQGDDATAVQLAATCLKKALGEKDWKVTANGNTITCQGIGGEGAGEGDASGVDTDKVQKVVEKELNANGELSGPQESVLNKIAEGSGMDTWFALVENDEGDIVVKDLEEGTELPVKDGVKMLCEGMTEDDWNALSEDEKGSFVDALKALGLEAPAFAGAGASGLANTGAGKAYAASSKAASQLVAKAQGVMQDAAALLAQIPGAQETVAEMNEELETLDGMQAALAQAKSSAVQNLYKQNLKNVHGMLEAQAQALGQKVAAAQEQVKQGAEKAMADGQSEIAALLKASGAPGNKLTASGLLDAASASGVDSPLNFFGTMSQAWETVPTGKQYETFLKPFNWNKVSHDAVVAQGAFDAAQHDLATALTGGDHAAIQEKAQAFAAAKETLAGAVKKVVDAAQKIKANLQETLAIEACGQGEAEYKAIKENFAQHPYFTEIKTGDGVWTKNADGTLKLTPAAGEEDDSEMTLVTTDVEGNTLKFPHDVAHGIKMAFKNNPGLKSMSDDNGTVWKKDANGVVKPAGGSNSGAETPLYNQKVPDASDTKALKAFAKSIHEWADDESNKDEYDANSPEFDALANLYKAAKKVAQAKNPTPMQITELIGAKKNVAQLMAAKTAGGATASAPQSEGQSPYQKPEHADTWNKYCTHMLTGKMLKQYGLKKLDMQKALAAVAPHLNDAAFANPYASGLSKPIHDAMQAAIHSLKDGNDPNAAAAAAFHGAAEASPKATGGSGGYSHAAASPAEKATAAANFLQKQINACKDPAMKAKYEKALAALKAKQGAKPDDNEPPKKTPGGGGGSKKGGAKKGAASQPKGPTATGGGTTTAYSSADGQHHFASEESAEVFDNKQDWFKNQMALKGLVATPAQIAQAINETVKPEDTHVINGTHWTQNGFVDAKVCDALEKIIQGSGTGGAGGGKGASATKTTQATSGATVLSEKKQKFLDSPTISQNYDQFAENLGISEADAQKAVAAAAQEAPDSFFFDDGNLSFWHNDAFTKLVQKHADQIKAAGATSGAGTITPAKTKFMTSKEGMEKLAAQFGHEFALSKGDAAKAIGLAAQEVDDSFFNKDGVLLPKKAADFSDVVLKHADQIKAAGNGAAGGTAGKTGSDTPLSGDLKTWWDANGAKTVESLANYYAKSLMALVPGTSQEDAVAALKAAAKQNVGLFFHDSDNKAFCSDPDKLLRNAKAHLAGGAGAAGAAQPTGTQQMIAGKMSAEKGWKQYGSEKLAQGIAAVQAAHPEFFDPQTGYVTQPYAQQFDQALKAHLDAGAAGTKTPHVVYPKAELKTGHSEKALDHVVQNVAQHKKFKTVPPEKLKNAVIKTLNNMPGAADEQSGALSLLHLNTFLDEIGLNLG